MPLYFSTQPVVLTVKKKRKQEELRSTEYLLCFRHCQASFDPGNRRNNPNSYSWLDIYMLQVPS